MHADIAIIGAGLSGLSCAEQLTRQGQKVILLEAAAQAGGRARSFFDQHMQQWVDHGPHLLSGAYQHTQALLRRLAIQEIAWQTQFSLHFWCPRRQHFSLSLAAYLPASLGLCYSLAKQAEHGLGSIIGLAKLKAQPQATESVTAWLQRQNIATNLVRDLIEPICLGALNEGLNTAPARSLHRVFSEAFLSQQHAKLGWFTAPLSQALIDPLCHAISTQGGQIHYCQSIKRIERTDKGFVLHSQAQRFTSRQLIFACTAAQRDKLLKQTGSHLHYAAISNLHLWFQEPLNIRPAILGSLGTAAQWYFHISALHHQPQHHWCAVYSCDQRSLSPQQRLQKVLQELEHINQAPLASLSHHRLIIEKRATTLSRAYLKKELPQGMFDACEQPCIGELPATIEAAIQQGQKAAQQALAQGR